MCYPEPHPDPNVFTAKDDALLSALNDDPFFNPISADRIDALQEIADAAPRTVSRVGQLEGPQSPPKLIIVPLADMLANALANSVPDGHDRTADYAARLEQWFSDRNRIGDVLHELDPHIDLVVWRAKCRGQLEHPPRVNKGPEEARRDRLQAIVKDLNDIIEDARTIESIRNDCHDARVYIESVVQALGGR